MAFLSLLVSEHEPVVAVQDELLYEIVNGQRVDLPPTSAYTTWLASHLHGRLGPYAEDKGLGTSVIEMLFVLDTERDLRRRPDVAFVSTTRWPLDRALPMTGDWNVVPDLVVEVLSPNDVFKDVLARVREYFHYGVQVVWVIAPEEQQVYVYDSPTHVRILTVQDDLTGGDVVAGFRMPLGQLFQHAVSSAVTPAL